MGRVYFVILIIFSSMVSANEGETRCKRWLEAPSNFKCSNGLILSYGFALCKTLSRDPSSGRMRATQPMPLYCNSVHSADVNACLHDSDPEVQQCTEEIRVARDMD